MPPETSTPAYLRWLEMENETMTTYRQATTLYGQPRGETREDGIEYAVGRAYYRWVDGNWKIAGTCTRITVSDDLPGLHCDMWRVQAFDGDALIFEAPLHSLEGVAYAAPPALAKTEAA